MSFTYFLIITFFMTIPGTVILLYAALDIQGSYVPLKRMLPYAAVAGTVLSLLRVLPVPFFLHTLVHLAMVIVIIRHLSQCRWSMAVLGALLTSVIAAVGEGLVTVPLLAVMGVPMAEALKHPWWTVSAGWLSNSPLVLLSLYFIVRRLIARREAR